MKVQEYEKAGLIKLEIEEVRAREHRDKEAADSDKLELRLKTLRKQQEAVVKTLLQKIQKDRNDHLKQRQSDTEKMIVRNKSLLTEVDHRHNEALKRVYEALHNLGLESEKNIKIKSR